MLNKTHVLLSVAQIKDGNQLSNSNIDRANELSKRTGKPCAITTGNSKFYTFTVVGSGDKFSTVELSEVI